MPVSEAKRRANARWNKENATMVGVQVKKTEAQRFKDACKDSGITPSMVIRVAMSDFVQRATGEPLFSVDSWDDFVQAHILTVEGTQNDTERMS